MFEDLRKAAMQLEDPRSRGQLATALGASLAVLVVLVGAIWLLLTRLALTDWGWLDWLIQAGGVLGAGLLAWLLFPVVVSAALGLFADELCDAVENRFYPHLPPARHQPLVEALGEGVRFAGLALLLNLLVLPFYLLPGPNILVYLALNGYLLGREYFGVVAARRMPTQEAERLRRHRSGHIWLAGVPIALLLTIPFVNLVAPMLGVAFMTHRYHKLGISERSS